MNVQPGDLVLVRKYSLPHYGEPYSESDRYVYGVIVEQPFIETHGEGQYNNWEYKRVRVLMEGEVRTVSIHQVKKIEKKDDI